MSNKKEGTGEHMHTVLRMSLSAAIGLALLFILLTVAAILINRDVLGAEHVTTLSFVSLVLSAAVASFLGSGAVRRLPHAIITAGLFFALLLLIGALSWGTPSLPSVLRSGSAVLLGGIVGGVSSSLRG